MRPPTGKVEAIIGRLAGAQHGVVTRRQLLSAGVTAAEIKHRLGSGALLKVHRGVYRVGHRAPSTKADYLAAVLACGEGAALAGRAAGHAYGLLKGAAPDPEVIVPRDRRVAGVTTRRLHLDSADLARWRGIPITTVPRTLVDLASALDGEQLARACHEAGVRFRTTPSQVERILQRRPNAAGAGKLRSVIRGDTKVTLSRLEGRFLRILRSAGLALPQTNRPAGGRRVDCRWPDLRLTIELDSYQFHNSRYAWEQDHGREREARRRGDDFRRFTWDDVTQRPALVLAELRPLLPAASPDSGRRTTTNRQSGGSRAG